VLYSGIMEALALGPVVLGCVLIVARLCWRWC
jgi:hypothetical protein